MLILCRKQNLFGKNGFFLLDLIYKCVIFFFFTVLCIHLIKSCHVNICGDILRIRLKKIGNIERYD